MASTIDLNLARQYFDEAAALFARDGGRLWGRSLEGPLMFVDYETRQVVANRPAAEGQLTPKGEVWVGVIPPEVIVANTAMTWAGVHWSVLLWQLLPEDPQGRAEFIAHEAFHRLQAELGFPMPTTPHSNAHLDTLEGRYWLQLEWRALECALLAPEPARLAALADALYFRARRRELFPGAAEAERAMEMHEGLASYTGFRLSDMDVAQTASRVRQAPLRYVSFVNTFAYASGPAYGYLLDELAPTWRKGLTPADDLGARLQACLGVELSQNLAEVAAARALTYDGPALWQAEVVRDQERQTQIAVYRARLLEGPVLILPLTEVQCAFDPRTTIPIPESGTVFPFVRVSDAWGVLDVREGGLWMANDWRTARIVAPTALSERLLCGEGWTLELADGWEIGPAERAGDYTLYRRPLSL